MVSFSQETLDTALVTLYLLSAQSRPVYSRIGRFHERPIFLLIDQISYQVKFEIFPGMV